MNRRAIALLTAGHCVIDFCQAVVPALLPFFVVLHDLSYAAAGGLVLAASLASSIVQPLFGRYADRVSAPWLLPVSILATSGGLVLAGTSSWYGGTLIALAGSSLGVAAFHPEAARLVNFAARDRLATGMSYFSLGGSLGFALAPLTTAAILQQFGQVGLVLILAPATVIALWCLVDRTRLIGMTADHHASIDPDRPQAAPQWGPFALLGLAIVFRSMVAAGLFTFLALYWMNRYSTTPEASNYALAALLAAGIPGTLLGGWLADRWGRRPLLRTSLFVVVGLLVLLNRTDDARVALGVVAVLGMVMAASSGVQVVIGQEYLPGHIGTASGVTIGLAVSCGGMSAPVLGRAADVWGLGVLPPILTVLAATATGLACLLPQPRSRRYDSESAPV